MTTIRGAGRPEAAQAIERIVDLFAAEIGLDPAEVRRRNFIAKDAFPYQTAAGATYDSGDYEGALELALRSVGYDDLRAEQRRRRDAGGTVELGIGISSYTEITNPLGEEEFGETTCATCHGPGAAEGKFEMPSGALPELDFSKQDPEDAAVNEFMAKEVKPVMANLLGLPEYTPENPTGFGCLHCHTMSKGE